MKNVYPENHGVDFYEKFATKRELEVVEIKVDGLTRDSAGMATAIEGLTKSFDCLNERLDTINKSIQLLITKKGVDEALLVFHVRQF